jgi:hypothetical protein
VQGPEGADGLDIAPYVTEITQLLRKNGKVGTKQHNAEMPANVYEVGLADNTIAYWPTSRANELPPSLLNPAIADLADIKQLLRKNFAIGSPKYIPDFAELHFEVLLTDGTISYWPTNKAKDLDASLLTAFASMNTRTSGQHNATRNKAQHNATRTNAQHNAARTAARSIPREEAVQDELVTLLTLLDLDVELFPCNLLKDKADVEPGQSSLKGDIEKKCALKFLNKTSHAAMMWSPCASCWENVFQKDMQNIDCSTSMPDKLFSPLKNGTWSNKAVFEFSATFNHLDGTTPS